MKACYADESGAHTASRFLVMVGIIVDLHGINRTRREFGEIFDLIDANYPERLREIKGQKLLGGHDGWRRVDPEYRKQIAGYLCHWIGERRHKLAVAAIDRQRFAGNPAPGPEVAEPWVAASLHLALQVQKAHQGRKRNKGNTILIFDEQKQHAGALTDLLWQTPPWTDSFYGRDANCDCLSQIFDTAFTIKSHHAGLVQVADLFAAIFRRFVELETGGVEEWQGEQRLISGYIEQLRPRLLPRGSRWPSGNSCPCARWYRAVAPQPLLVL